MLIFLITWTGSIRDINPGPSDRAIRTGTGYLTRQEMGLTPVPPKAGKETGRFSLGIQFALRLHSPALAGQAEGGGWGAKLCSQEGVARYAPTRPPVTANCYFFFSPEALSSRIKSA